MNERLNESIQFPEYLQRATRTGNGFNTVIMYILPSKQEREILFEAARTCVLVETLCLQRMRVRFATQQRDTSGLINQHF